MHRCKRGDDRERTRQRAAKTKAARDRSRSGDVKAGRLCTDSILNVICTPGRDIGGEQQTACPAAGAVATEEVRRG